jgi:hypothetical protein
MAADFTLTNHGSLVTLLPATDEAREHLAENVSDEAQWWAGALVVEPRYVADLVEQLQANGWEVR